MADLIVVLDGVGYLQGPPCKKLQERTGLIS